MEFKMQPLIKTFFISLVFFLTLKSVNAKDLSCIIRHNLAPVFDAEVSTELNQKVLLDENGIVGAYITSSP